MTFSEILSVDRIFPDLESDTQWGAIVEMVDHLHDRDLLSGGCRERVIESLHVREEQMSTAVGSGVAIPHAFCDDLDSMSVAFGRSSAGIDGDSVDNLPIEFIILLLVPESKRPAHLKTLAAVGRFFSNGQVRNALREAEGGEGIFRVFDDASD